jgi:hypothetical protein
VPVCVPPIPPLLVAGAVVLGTAAVGYGAYKLYQSPGEQEHKGGEEVAG